MRLVADSACDIKELEGMVFKAVPLTISTGITRSFVMMNSLIFTECLMFLKNIRDVHTLRVLE